MYSLPLGQRRAQGPGGRGPQILTVATALLAAGIATGLGGSIFIAAFTGGFLFGVVGRDSGGEASYLVDEGGELVNAVTFIVFGAAILGPALDDLGWSDVVCHRVEAEHNPVRHHIPGHSLHIGWQHVIAAVDQRQRAGSSH